MADADAVKMGGAAVELQADPTKLRAGLSAGQAAVKRWGDAVGVGLTPLRASIGLVSQLGGAVTGLGYTLGGIGLALGGLGAAVVGPLTLALHSFAEAGADLLALSDRTGIAVEALGRLKYVATQTGTQMGMVEMGVRRLQIAIAKAGEAKAGKAGISGGGPGAKALAGLDIDEGGLAEVGVSGAQAAESIGKLGLNLAKLQGMDSAEQLEAVGRALDSVKNQSEKTRLANDLLSRGGTRLFTFFAEMDRLSARYVQLGLGTSRQAAEEGKNLQQAYTDVGLVMGKVGSVIAGALAPAVTDLLRRQAENLSVLIGWVRGHKDLVIAAGLAGVALVGLGGAFAGLGTATVIAGSAISGAATVATAAVGGLSLVLGIASGAMGILDASAAAMTPLLASMAPASAAAAAGEVAVAAGATLVDVAMGGLPLIIGAVVVGFVALGVALGGLALLTGGAFVAALLAGAAAWLYWSNSAHKAVGDLAGEFSAMGAAFKVSWGGIVDAISSGDVMLAARIAGLGIKVALLEHFPDTVRQFTLFTAALATGFAIVATAAEKAVNALEALFLAAGDPANARKILEFAERANKALDARLKEERKQIAVDAAITVTGLAGELQRAKDELAKAQAQAREGVTHGGRNAVIGGLGLAALAGGALGGAGGAAKDAAAKISAVGTFNAAAIFGLGGGGPLEGIERNTAAANGHLKKIAAAGRFKIV